jgi:hypothetical protein
MNKYHNVPVLIDGIKFDSQKEGRYYAELKLRRQAGEVVRFEMQVPFQISINDKKVCKYYADFVEYWRDGSRHVVDVKGRKTAVYQLKKKLVRACFGIEIEEK